MPAEKGSQWSKFPDRDRDMDDKAINSYVVATLRDLALVVESRNRRPAGRHTSKDAHPLQRDERLTG